jgi:hypothetical protein
MNDKIKAILLKIAKELQKHGWNSNKEMDITFKSEGSIMLSRSVPVKGSLNDQEWNENIQTELALKIGSDDQITWFPEYTIISEIYMRGGNIKDINYQMDIDVGFLEKDARDQSKIVFAARKINQYVVAHMQEEYYDYLDSNATEIEYYNKNQGDEDEDR